MTILSRWISLVALLCGVALVAVGARHNILMVAAGGACLGLFHFIAFLNPKER